LVGQLLARHKRHQEAALAFLSIAILYPQHAELGGDALLSAGRELEKLGQHDEAQRLYEETIASFPDSESAQEAERLWKKLTEKTSR
jgi:TolA-binding protein